MNNGTLFYNADSLMLWFVFRLKDAYYFQLPNVNLDRLSALIYAGWRRNNYC